MTGLVGRIGAGLKALGASALLAGMAVAAEPLPWHLDMQPAVTPVAERAHALHNELLVIITVIVIFVLGLLAYVCVRFRASAHPNPTRTSHNTIIEILWTVIPILILLVIAVPSLKLIYFQEETPADAAMTLKVTGLQWYWHYDYPDKGGFAFDSYGIKDEDLKPGQKRLLDVDNEVVLPVGKDIRIQIAGSDVMHSWFVPAFAVQKYAVVGRLNEVWVNISKPGIYYGECNQICGVDHAFMPIKIRAVEPAEFDAWVATAKQKFAAAGTAPTHTQVASLAP